MARLHGRNWSISTAFGCCCLPSLCIMTLAQSPSSSLSANGSEVSTVVAKEVLGDHTDHGQSTVEENGRGVHSTSRLSLDCEHFTSMSYIDHATGVLHACTKMCPKSDGMWDWCNRFCPEYYKCLNESRLQHPTLPTGWSTSSWLNSTAGNGTDYGRVVYGPRVSTETVLIALGLSVGVLAIFLIVICAFWCRVPDKKNAYQDLLVYRTLIAPVKWHMNTLHGGGRGAPSKSAEKSRCRGNSPAHQVRRTGGHSAPSVNFENECLLPEKASSARAVDVADDVGPITDRACRKEVSAEVHCQVEQVPSEILIKSTSTGSRISLRLLPEATKKSSAARDENDAPKKTNRDGAAPVGAPHLVSLPVRASTRSPPSEHVESCSFEDPSEEEATRPESPKACPEDSPLLSLAVEEEDVNDEQTHPKVLDTGVAHKDLHLENDREGARGLVQPTHHKPPARAEDLFQGVPKSTLREKLNGISWVQTKNFCFKVLEITVDHVAETEDKEKAATDLAEKLGIPKESIRLLRLLKGTKPTLRLTPSGGEPVLVLNNGEGETFIIGAEVEVEGETDQYALTVSHPITVGQRCFFVEADKETLFLGTIYAALHHNREADAAIIRIDTSIRLDPYVCCPRHSLRVRPKLYYADQDLLEDEIVTKMTADGLLCMAGSQATDFNCGKVISTDYEIPPQHGYSGLRLIGVISTGGSQQRFHEEGESGTLLIKRDHHEGTVEAIGLLFATLKFQLENGVKHFVSLAFPLTDVMSKLSNRLKRSVSFPADRAAMDSGISTMRGSPASGTIPTSPSQADFCSISVTQD